MCNCSGSCGCSNSSMLPVGPAGANGVNGIYGGYSGEWLYSSTTTVTPGPGELRFNSNTSASVTNIFISNTGDNAIAYNLFLASLSNSSNYGFIRIFKEFDSTKFWMGTITNIVSVGTYYNITVTHTTSSFATILNNIFTVNDRIVFSFIPKGSTGSNGTNGTNGTNGAAGATGATGAQGPKGPSTLDYSWGVADVYWLIQTTNTFIDIALLVFEGSTFHTGSPTKITVLAKLKDPLTSGDAGLVNIYDKTNSVIIASSSSINSDSWALYDMPITGAIPAGQAMWAVQGFMETAGGSANRLDVAALSIRF